MRKVVFLIFISFFAHSLHAQDVMVGPADSNIYYMGRVDVQSDGTVLSWSGTSVKINFTGGSVKALLKDEWGQNYYNVIIDGKITQKIHPDTDKRMYILAANLPAGKHSLELFKLTEWAMGKTWFYGLTFDSGAGILPAPVVKKRKIEFFGNSITCGYAVLDSSGKDRGTAPYEDNYKSYAAITARHFDADYRCIARSGIGILISWFPLIMPEMYNRLDASNEASHWDFEKYTPDVVVINLFQNDSWLVEHPEHAEFKHRFGTQKPTPAQIIKAYQNFVSSLRSVYPKAHIICALGNMDATASGSAWPGYIKQAVNNLHDKKIYPLMFTAKNTPGHPNIKEQQDMAQQLISFIGKNIKW